MCPVGKAFWVDKNGFAYFPVGLKPSDYEIIEIKEMNEKGLERLQSLMNEICEWSDKQFNKGIYSHERSLPISHHLIKEAKELTVALSDFFENKTDNDLTDKLLSIGEELSDVFMLLLDCATHMGYDADDLITATFNKLEENKMRKWGKPDINGVVEHIRDKKKGESL